MSIRFSIIYFSLFLILVAVVAFATGPVWGLRLDYEKGEQIQLIQIIIPTFLAYLSAAITYATARKTFREPRGERGHILRVITLGSMLIFVVGIIAATVVFHMSGSGKLANGAISFSQYSSIVSVLLGVLAATTTAISTYIFSSDEDAEQ